MNKLIIKRPKIKEKIYSGASFKIYINNIYVDKIGQNQIKEIETEDTVFQIQAKYIGGWRSPKKTIDLSKTKEIEITANTKIEIPPLLFLSIAFPIFAFGINHEKYILIKIIAFMLTLFLFIRGIIQQIKVSRKGILIEENFE